MNDDVKITTGTGKWYSKTNVKTKAVAGKANVNDNVAREVNFKNGEDLVISWNPVKRELCMKPLTLTY